MGQPYKSSDHRIILLIFDQNFGISLQFFALWLKTIQIVDSAVIRNDEVSQLFAIFAWLALQEVYVFLFEVLRILNERDFGLELLVNLFFEL